MVIVISISLGSVWVLICVTLLRPRVGEHFDYRQIVRRGHNDRDMIITITGFILPTLGINSVKLFISDQFSGQVTWSSYTNLS